MAVARNLTIDRGANVEIDIAVSSNGSPINLTGYTANATFKKHHGSANTSTMTTEGYANGVLRVTMTAEESAAVSPEIYVYEVKMTHTASGTVTRIQEGLLTVKPSV